MAKKKSKKCSSIIDVLKRYPLIGGDYEVAGTIHPFYAMLDTIFTFDRDNPSEPCASAEFAVKSICAKLCALTHKTITIFYYYEKVDTTTGEVGIGQGRLSKESEVAILKKMKQ